MLLSSQIAACSKKQMLDVKICEIVGNYRTSHFTIETKGCFYEIAILYEQMQKNNIKKRSKIKK
jgi:hypothetical protein